MNAITKPQQLQPAAQSTGPAPYELIVVSDDRDWRHVALIFSPEGGAGQTWRREAICDKKCGHVHVDVHWEFQQSPASRPTVKQIPPAQICTQFAQLHEKLVKFATPTA